MERSRGIAFVALAAAAAACRGSVQEAAAPPASSSDARLAGGSRHEQDGWIVLHLEGPPDAIGFQHGWLAADEIDDALAMFRQYVPVATKRDWSFYRATAAQFFWPKLDEEQRGEIEGIAAGARARGKPLDRIDVVALNGWIEIAWYRIPQLDRLQNKAPGNCSAFAATGSWTKDGRIVMAHNAWIDYAIGARWNLVLDLVPERGHRLFMDSFPGFIHSGDDFAVTDAGLVVTETTITGFHGFDPEGAPEFSRARRAVQYADSIDEWAALMKERNNGAYANSWLVGDCRTNEIARLELGLKNAPLERTKDGFFVGSNFPADEKLRREETTFKADDLKNSPNARRCRFEALMQEQRGKIDVELARRFLADHFDATTGAFSPSFLCLCGHGELDARGAPEWEWPPFFPAGASQSKATDAALAQRLSFFGVTGHACGLDFRAAPFLEAHPEFGWQKPFLRDLPAGRWTFLQAGREARSRP